MNFKKLSPYLAGLALLAALILPLVVATADSSAITFEPTAYASGSIHNQDGWSSLGSAGDRFGSINQRRVQPRRDAKRLLPLSRQRRSRSRTAARLRGRAQLPEEDPCHEAVARIQSGGQPAPFEALNAS